MGKAAVFIRHVGIILSAATLLTAASCRAKREINSTVESAHSSHRFAASTLNDSLSLIIDIALDSAEIALVNPLITDNGSPAKVEAQSGTKAYGIRATLRSQRLTAADMSSTETKSAASEESSSREVSATADPLLKSLLPTALIISSAILIFIHIKRK